MESPVVLEKPSEYHGKRDERGFPFDEEESGAWSSLAARHPDIAARLRQRPATWARKRRPSSQDPTDDFGDTFGGFDGFPFDDIPSEFRDSFPSHWGRRFEEAPRPHPHPQQSQQSQPAPTSPQPQQASAATQTEPGPAHHTHTHTPLPQYGLRNTVDLGQKSATDPSVDADERAQRSMSAPPDARAHNNNSGSNMSAHEQQEQAHQPGNVRHIPIFVEGRDEPVINRNVDHGAHFGDTKPHPPPPQPHVDREQYFADDGPPAFHHPPNFSRAFGTPFGKGFRQGPQPFTQQKAYPQTAFARGASPQRSQSPKPHHDEFVKTHHEPRAQAAPHPPQQHHPQQQQQQHHPPQQQQHHPQQQQQQHAPPPQPPHAPSPPPKQQPVSNDPITVILAIQTDVLNLMSEVENFTGTKKDKKYIYLDEMLTRNLIKLDNIETDGKENIRQARREAIKCIQKCIAVLEAKAESNANANANAAATQEVEMAESAPEQQPAGNGEVEMKEDTKDEAKPEAQKTKEPEQKVDQKPQEPEQKAEPTPEKPEEAPQPPDTRPETRAVLVENKPEQETDKKTTPKKKVVKKRDKSKDNTPKDSNKEGGDGKQEEKAESMQVDNKGDQTDSQKMEVDGASASQ